MSAAAQGRNNGVTHYVPPPNERGAVDFVNARPVPLPKNVYPQDATVALMQALSAPPAPGIPGFLPGAEGDGRASPVSLGVPALLPDDSITSQEFGTSGHPFSTAKADLDSGGGTATNTRYPYRAAGKLFFKIGTSSYVCSASLIRRGVVVTAAHCVTGYGGAWYTNHQFVPGYRNGSAPYGTWTAASITVVTAYKNGADTCSQAGVVCRNDVAVIQLTPQSGAFPGTNTGWFSVGWDGYGFNSASTNLTQISQLGYPVCLDNGAYMQRNDSYGFRNTSMVDNTVIGSLMCGGSSGGPWLVNLGIRPTTLSGTASGTAPQSNTVVGVTSWGYTDSTVKQQGASRFVASNIGSLLNTVCPTGTTAAYCN